MNDSNRRKMLTVDGVAGLVGSRGLGTPIPDSEIDAVRAVVTRRICWTPYPFMKAGDRVRVHGGALDGIEGILLSDSGDLPSGRLVSLANFTAEAGSVYYFRVRTTGGPSSYLKDRDRSASIDLEPVSSDEGKLLVASSPWSNSQPKIQKASR